MGKNTSVFNEEYANIYDYLYQDQDFEKECDFLEEIFNKSGKKVKTILDLGCGTGGHALILAKRGYKVTGIDQSEDMLKAAKRKADRAGLKIDFHKSLVQDLKLNETFDAVISMSAVMSYMTDNKVVALACGIAKQHLNSGGCFVFDVWNGLAVTTDPPAQRVKEIHKEGERIIRFTKPDIDMIAHTVDVNFEVLILKKDKLISETEETHKVRYFYPQEIRYFLEVAGFSDIKFCPVKKLDSPITTKERDMSVIAQ